MDLKLGLGDWSVSAAYLLNIFGALFCVVYAFYTVRKARSKR